MESQGYGLWPTGVSSPHGCTPLCHWDCKGWGGGEDEEARKARGCPLAASPCWCTVVPSAPRGSCMFQARQAGNSANLGIFLFCKSSFSKKLQFLTGWRFESTHTLFHQMEVWNQLAACPLHPISTFGSSNLGKGKSQVLPDAAAAPGRLRSQQTELAADQGERQPKIH